jgi:hypothetical protein
MNVKLKAVLQTVAFFAVCFLSATVAHYLPIVVVGALALAGMFYLVYSLLLSRLQWDQKLKDIVNK